jgi:protein-tyrosine phosphatase
MPADRRARITAPAPRHPFSKYRVCLVCLGNICRSPMAEVVLRSELDRVGLAGRVEVDSAGTGDWHIGSPMDSRARAELALRGYDGSGHRARQFGPSWFGRYDLVAAMDSANLRDLRAMAPDHEAADRIRLFRSFDPALAVRRGHGDPDGHGEAEPDVPDPYGGTAAEYALAFDLVQPAAAGLAVQLAGLLPAQPASAG